MAGYIVTGILGLVLAWIGVSAMTERGAKEPPYTVERKADGYEVRRYEPWLVAEAEVPPGSDDPLGTGFRMLFDYIRGANRSRTGIPMTKPVLKEETPGETIAMTKPVLRQEEGTKTQVAFVLPAGYTLETAPQPDNPNIRIRALPARRLAVIRFSGYASEAVVEKQRSLLAARLARDGLQSRGPIVAAYYNPPWTPPFMRRNEVLAPLE
jgi:hypothetical protein